MARIHDWLKLAETTLKTVQSRDVAELYELEWPEAKSRLLEEHRESIAKEKRSITRFIRTCSALMYGLTKRLAPQRRLLFAAAQIGGLLSLFYLFVLANATDVSSRVVLSTALAFFVMTFLLAMELLDKLKFRDELELARELQAGLIPKRMPHVPGFDLAADNQIANTVGGDIYDFVPLPDGRLAVLFGDASGHGMAAGLVMAVAHAAFRTQLDIDPSPPAIIGALNRILCRTGGSRSFFSACYLLIEPDGKFLATVAGHPPILQLDSRGQVTTLGTGSYPLGIKTNLQWPVTGGEIRRGESIILHSDGLVEARNMQDRQMGYDFLETVVGWHPASDAEEIRDGVMDEWRTFVGARKIDDDVSIAVIHRLC